MKKSKASPAQLDLFVEIERKKRATRTRCVWCLPFAPAGSVGYGSLAYAVCVALVVGDEPYQFADPFRSIKTGSKVAEERLQSYLR